MWEANGFEPWQELYKRNVLLISLWNMHLPEGKLGGPRLIFDSVLQMKGGWEGKRVPQNWTNLGGRVLGLSI